jgi:hypothetical protein
VADYLLPIADRDALSWIVSEQRTALGAHRSREAQSIDAGDRLFLYTTRGCFHNPTRDRGRVIGIAFVTDRAHTLTEPVRFGERAYPLEIRFQIDSLAPLRDGVELVPLLHRLDSFPKRRGWSMHLRRALVPLSPHDATVIARALDGIAGRYSETSASYTD